MFRSSRAARSLTAAVVALAALLVAPSVVSAQPRQTVGDLQAQAKQIAQRLNDLNSKSDSLDEAYLQAQDELASLKAKLADNEAAVAKATSDFSADKDLAKHYAVAAYVQGDPVDPVLLQQDDKADASRRSTFLKRAQGDRQQVIAEVDASRGKLDDSRKALQQAKDKIDQKVAAAGKAKSDLQDTIKQQQQVQQAVNGQLGAAVHAEQARLAAAQAAASEKAARNAAAAAAAAAARPVASIPVPAASKSTSSSNDNADNADQADTSVDGGDTQSAFPDPGPATPGALAAIAAAKAQLGVPYRWGASAPGSGFDCSGLVLYAWGQAGVSLPHSSRAMHAMTQRISADQLQPGDLIFGGDPVHHVGLYVGNGLMIHAPHTGDVVKISSIYSASNPVSFGHLSS